jgi:hypothetical protein
LIIVASIYASLRYTITEKDDAMKLPVFQIASTIAPGKHIHESWFRTGQEIQPGDIWVGAYYLGDATGSTGNDHLWCVGSVGPEVTNPTWRACSWVPC